MKKVEKTNVMRVLDSKKISYKEYTYDNTNTNGLEIANLLGEEPGQVFKTLVTISSSNKNYVFMVPVDKELNLKKAAKACGEKKIEMIKSKDLLGLTGYIHGGCSPIGMKKFFPTFIDSSATNYEHILFSGGKVGFQVEVAFADLQNVIKLGIADLAE